MRRIPSDRRNPPRCHAPPRPQYRCAERDRPLLPGHPGRRHAVSVRSDAARAGHRRTDRRFCQSGAPGVPEPARRGRSGRRPPRRRGQGHGLPDRSRKFRGFQHDHGAVLPRTLPGTDHDPGGRSAARCRRRGRRDSGAAGLTVGRRAAPAAGDEAVPASLPGVTRTVATQLAKLGLKRGFDLVLHLPLRYEDETRITPIVEAPHGLPTQVEGVVVDCDVKFRPRKQLVARVRDAGGELTVRLLHFYPSASRQLAVGSRVRLSGEIRHGFFGAEMVHPRIRTVGENTALPTRLTPVYSTTAGLSQSVLRRAVAAALDRESLDDTLPAPLLARLKLPAFEPAVRLLHDPTPDVPLDALASGRHPAWQRIKFDELLAQQLSMHLHRQRRDAARAVPLGAGTALANRLLDVLPFALTGAQQRALTEIRADLARPHPMHRLLQGDVGSGKTVVAALAALCAVESGRQVAVMAPTEILAEQHYAKFRQWLGALDIDVVWITGSLTARERRAALEAIESGKAAVAVGTQALFQEHVRFHDLALAIVDEQHRFGVHQRLALRLKGADGEASPHQLMMSATPIPRTLAMSFYADLDVSVIDELPPGRTPVVTKLVSDARRDEVLQRVRDACVTGSQAYWVCPLIEESEQLELKTAIDTHALLQQTFPELRVGLVHGRLPTAEKAATMAAFKAGEIQLLVATTVIEVGVDVPNATLMVIEHAERMGLAQLHQLRGRVGRGTGESACILMYQQPLSQLARERLRVIYENTDGFEIAREDLRIRGPGELLGARQSGVPMLRFADLELDSGLLEAARDAAAELLRRHPDRAKAHVERWLASREELLRA
ncbi:MAG: ATP-dependent DNA helicase RecG [Burkholderiales bacterium]|nr:ATP-dependent DNA helicase RecG [Burkholderiales bacterium]